MFMNVESLVVVECQSIASCLKGKIVGMNVYSRVIFPVNSQTLIILGSLLIVIGLAWTWFHSIPLGRLPGDIVIEKDNFRLYFPITTMVIASAVISVLFWLFRH